MDTLKLFMAIPGKVNFLQMGRYGEFSEQTYRNNFENEAFDWFLTSISSERFQWKVSGHRRRS